jgi:hypothetical protein
MVEGIGIHYRGIYRESERLLSPLLPELILALDKIFAA